MGAALVGWRKTVNFKETVVQKAKDGCKVRILLMHQENQMLPAISVDMEMQIKNITQTTAFFKSLTQESNNIEVRQILNGMPYFFLTRSDQYVITIQYLTSQKWGSGPLFRCTPESKLYDVYTKEFDTLWDLNSPSQADQI